MTTPVTQQNGLMQLVGMVQASAGTVSAAAAAPPGLFAGVFSQAMQVSNGQSSSAAWLTPSPTANGQTLPQEGQGLPLVLGWMQQAELSEEQVAALSSFLAADAARSEAAFDALLQKMPPQLQEQLQQVTAVSDQAPHQVLQDQLLAALQGYATGRPVLGSLSQPVWRELPVEGNGQVLEEVDPRLSEQLLAASGLSVREPLLPKVGDKEIRTTLPSVESEEVDPEVGDFTDESVEIANLSDVPVVELSVEPSQAVQVSADAKPDVMAQSVFTRSTEQTDLVQRADMSIAVDDARMASEQVAAAVAKDQSNTTVAVSAAQAAAVSAAQAAAVSSGAVANAVSRPEGELRPRTDVKSTGVQTAANAVLNQVGNEPLDNAQSQAQVMVKPTQSVMPSPKNTMDNVAQSVSEGVDANSAQSPTSRSASATDWLQAASQSLGALKSPVTTQPQLSMPAGMAPSHPAWSQSLSERVVWSAGQQLQSATIQLDPPELGSLHVRLQVVNDQVSVTFTSAHASVRDAVEQSMPRLRELFEQQGLNLGESMVKDQSQGREQRQQHSYAQAERLGTQPAYAADAPVTTQQTQSLSLVDYYA